MVTTPKPAAELVGLVYSETPREVFQDPGKRRKGLVLQARSARRRGAHPDHHSQHRLPLTADGVNRGQASCIHLFDIRNVIGALLGIYGVVPDHRRLRPRTALGNGTRAQAINPVDLYFGTDAELVGRARPDRRGGRVLRLGAGCVQVPRQPVDDGDSSARTGSRVRPRRHSRLELFLVGRPRRAPARRWPPPSRPRRSRSAPRRVD